MRVTENVEESPFAGDEGVKRRLHQLEQVTDVSLSHLSLDKLLTELLDRVRELLHADTAAVLLVDESKEYLVATAAQGLEEEVRQGSRVPVGLGFAGRIAAERKPVAIAEVNPMTVVNPVLLYKGIQSMLGVPLLQDGDLVGVLHVGTLRKRFFTEADSRLLQHVADRIATAVRMEEARTDLSASRALQRSLAPGKLPHAVGLDLAARYVAGSRTGVGGDWYDVFDLPDGRLGLVIGDVMGHGLKAATIMGRLRAALRAFAMSGDDPAMVLRQLDAYVHHFEPGMMASAIYAIQVPGSSTVSLASAGHLPPVLVKKDRGAELLALPEDVLLGVEPEAPRSTIPVELTAGATLCLYTDGLLERRDRGIQASMDDLRRALAGEHGSAESTAAHVMAALLDDDQRDDDIALLVVRRNI